MCSLAGRGGVSHIQYADDTIIMINGSESSILHLKIVLYCFEWLSGLKMNFHKSDVYVFGVEQAEQEWLANMLNYRLGDWPTKYLGILVSISRFGATSFGRGPRKSSSIILLRWIRYIDLRPRGCGYDQYQNNE